MLRLYTCVIMLLLRFDFNGNIPCLCYSIRSSPRDTAAEIVPNLHQISFLFESTLPYVAQMRRNFEQYLLIQQSPETNKKLYHLHFEFQCELVLACWWKKPCFFLKFLLFMFCQSRFIASCQLANLAFPVEFLEKSHNHFTFITKFGKVTKLTKFIRKLLILT